MTCPGKERLFCLTLSLHDDEELIREYEAWHKPGRVYPEVIDAIRASGVLDLRIYRRGVQLVMVMLVSEEFSFERKAQLDSEIPRVMEWERLMERFQNVGEGGEKWKLMPEIFSLSEQ